MSEMNLPDPDDMSTEELERRTDPNYEKQDNKDIRSSMMDAPELTLEERSRMALSAHKRLDADFYMAKYPQNAFMWINDMDGDVQRWIEIGAEPVESVSKSRRVFAGLTDKNDGEWVRAIGGTDEGGRPFYVYLLMMEHGLYEDVKLAPLRAKQEEIHRALIGDRSGMDTHISGYGSLQTYNPNLPTGDVGYHEERETVAAAPKK